MKSTVQAARRLVYARWVRRQVRRLATLVVCLALGLAPVGRCAAQRAGPERCLEDLSDAEIAARMDAVEGAFRRARPRARRWFWIWTAINGALAVGTAGAAIAFRDEPLQRDSNILGSAGSAVTLLLMFAPPLPAVFGLDRLEAMPVGDRDARIARLREGERMLERTAMQERIGTGPLNYVLASGYAAFTGLYLGLRYDDVAVTVTLSVAGTIAFPVAQILSGPTDAITDWERLRDASRPCMAPALRSPRGPEVRLAPAPGGVGLALRF